MTDPRPMTDPARDRVPHDGPRDPARRPADTRSAPALIGDLIGHATELFRKEMMLFRAEMHEKIAQVTSAGGMLAGALVLGLVGLIYLAGAAVLGLVAAGLGPVWAVLIVGVVLALVAAVMALSGKKKLTTANLAPKRTVGSVSRDATMAREKVK